jgi:hypothetical protein
MGLNRVRIRKGRVVNRVIMVTGGVLVAAAAGASFDMAGAAYVSESALLVKIVRVSGALLVVCTAMTMKPVFFTLASRLLLRLSRAAFFLYGCHWCVLFCVSVLLKHLPQWRWLIGHEFFLFVAVVTINVTVSLSGYVLLKRYAPFLLALLDGNRSVRAAQGIGNAPASGAP